MGVARNNGTPIATNLTHLFRFINSHQYFHACSSVKGAKEYLRLERPMYLGGVPEDIAKEAFSKWHLRNITSFKGKLVIKPTSLVEWSQLRLPGKGSRVRFPGRAKCEGKMTNGCMKAAWINHKRVDYVNAVRVQRTSAGCGEDEPTSSMAATVFVQEDAGRHNQDPCVPNPCARGGRCVREEGSPSDYTCRCRAGTAGPQCELRASIMARHPARWSDDIRKVAGSGWMRRAEDRAQWHAIGEAYVQQ
uniref:SFRICE_020843 n=1 Tax=Spodoptera frugiperda TaxID=7108 RepID=A0A2H1WP82_SPOFR